MARPFDISAGSRCPLSWAIGIALVAVCAALQPARAQNLVQNPGFEFSKSATESEPWQVTAGDYTPFFDNGGFTPHSGDWSAVFGSGSPNPGNDGILSQSIATVPMTTYVVSFFLESVDPGNSNFTVAFGDQTIFSLTTGQPFAFTEYSATVTADSTASVVSFGATRDSQYYVLDDVSVEAAPAPVAGGGIACFILAVACLLISRGRNFREIFVFR